MTYSYTQISQYLRCPRSYRYRYLDGWREKDTEHRLLFGRCFEKALAAFFAGEDSSARAVQGVGSLPAKRRWNIRKGDNWERMFRQGCAAARAAGARQPHPYRPTQQNMQVKLVAVASGRATISWPTSMPSELWMASRLYWNGRPPRHGIRKSPRDCWPSILS